MKQKLLSAAISLVVLIVGSPPVKADTLTVSISAATDFYMNASVGQVISAQTNLTAGDPMLWLYLGANLILSADDNGQNLNGNNLNSTFSYTVPTGGGGNYRLRAAQYANESGASMSARYSLFISAPGAITSSSSDTTGPAVTGISITSSAGSDGTYTAGDVIAATVTWSENAIVAGIPRIPIQGLTSKFFTFASGSGTTSLVFNYTVVSGDADADGISINANTLELNGGTIRDAAANNATLTHSAVTASSTHKIDTSAPTHSSSAVNSAGTTVTMTYNEGLSSTTAPTSSFAVIAGGTSVAVSSVSISGSTVVLNLATTIRIAQSVTVAYTDPTAGNDASAVQDIGGNDASTLSATSVTNNSTVKQTQAALTLTTGSTSFGTNFRLVTSGGSGTGSVSYSTSSGSCSIINTDSLTATSAGSCVVVATKAADATFASAFDTQTITVNRATRSMTIALSPSSSSITYGRTVPLSATISAGSADGSLTYSAGSSTGCSIASLTSVTAILGGGTCSITATLSRGTNYETATATLTLTVNRATQNPLSIGQYTAFPTISSYPINVYGGSGTGSVTRTLVGAGSAGCTITSGMFLNASRAGTCDVQVVKAGDTNFLDQIVTSTVYWVTWSDAYATRVASPPTEIVLNHQTSITKYSFDTLTVTSYADNAGAPITSAAKGQVIRVVGQGFLSTDLTTQVTFTSVEIAIPSLITSTYMTVTVPTDAVTGIVAVDSLKGTAYGPSLTITG